MRVIKTAALLLLGCLILIPLFSAATTTKQQTNQTFEIKIDSWLQLGPLPIPLPAFTEETTPQFPLKNLLTFNELDAAQLHPRAKKQLKWQNGRTAAWQPVSAPNGYLILNSTDPNPAVVYLATYIDIKRWTKTKITANSAQMYRIYIDNTLIATKTNNGANGQQTAKDIRLEPGKHLVLIKTVYDPTAEATWDMKVSLTQENKFSQEPPAVTLSPLGRMTLHNLLDGPKVTSASISPCGELAAITLRQSLPPSDSSESWIELYRLTDNKLVRSFRGSNGISRIQWAPRGKKFSFTRYDKSNGTIWVFDLEDGSSRPILSNIKNLAGHSWSPDASFLIYMVSEDGAKDKPGVKRLQNMSDRQPGYRNKTFLYKLDLVGGTRLRLTSGELSTNLNSISPDGKKLLFTRSLIDYTTRPYTKTELYCFDLTSMRPELLWEGFWLNSAEWCPFGPQILILGGPSTFGDTGKNVASGTIPNDYDTQAYLFDPATKEAEPISKYFDPAINQAVWSEAEKALYFTATDRSYVRMFRFDMASKKFFRLSNLVEATGGLDIARAKPVAVFTGSSASVPPKAYVMDLATKKTQILKDPGKEDYINTEFGKVERWTFKNKKGTEIEGRIYYPPGFDPGQKYPCIVNYYGGTSPVTRGFGGRYPLNYYAAQDYVVYVLQPSGATGFGQKFSALHVNDWGIIVADEIIDGVKKFLNAHSFIDRNRIGCIGASYGGFMTMLLQTRTNIFASAIAHAGISSISSYWGEGYWGFLYSAIAAANSFPWNRKDIYFEQSPLFSADKISTPLLLLHGSVDTNVPLGESTQLYTALKLLGREVEYIQIEGQNHHIMTYNKRILWTKTIIAWFDRWLKKQPEWWDDLYPIR